MVVHEGYLANLKEEGKAHITTPVKTTPQLPAFVRYTSHAVPENGEEKGGEGKGKVATDAKRLNSSVGVS